MTDADQDPTRIEPALDPTGAVPATDPTQVGDATVFADDGGTIPPGGPWLPSEPPPPDRRPWIIAALLAVIALILVLLLLLQDDDDDASTSSTSTTPEVTTSTSTSTSTTAPSTTTSTAPTTTTEAPAVTVPPATCAAAGAGPAKPGLAAETVYEAWVRGDQACAATLTTNAALTELFSRDGTGATDEFQGCTNEELPDPHTDCAFTYEGGATHYLMNFSDTDGWQVFDITQVAD